MSKLRIAGTTPLTIDDSAASATAPDTEHHHPVDRHRHHAHRNTPRLRTKRRRGADAQDGIDESGASEELQMMLNEHLQRTTDIVMRVAERRNGERDASDEGGRQNKEDSDDRTVTAAGAGAATSANGGSAA